MISFLNLLVTKNDILFYVTVTLYELAWYLSHIKGSRLPGRFIPQAMKGKSCDVNEL
jgi:hypothetical protein